MLISDVNDDELQSYSTQIVPPQDLFGLGQAGPLAALVMGPTFGSIFAGLFVASGIYFGTQKLKPVRRPKTFAERNGNWLLKNRGAAAVVSGVLVGGFSYWMIGKIAGDKPSA